MRALNMFAATALLATVLSGQAAPIGAQERDRALKLLGSPILSEKAWGAYLGSRLHLSEIDSKLIEQFQIATAFRDAPRYSELHTLLTVLFDALIEGHVEVPTELLEPFERGWTTHVVILSSVARGSEQLLLRLASRSSGIVWLAANNVLFERRSQQWYEMLWRDIELTHDFTDTGKRSSYRDDFSEPRAFCGDGSPVAMPKDFPPVGTYDLDDTAFPGSVLLAEGPRHVYYTRGTVPTNGKVGVGWCDSLIKRGEMRIEYLSDLSGEPVENIEQLLHASTTIRNGASEDILKRIDKSMESQEVGIRRLLREIEKTGLQTPQIFFQIKPVLRTTGNDALPQLNPRVFRAL